MTTKSYVDIHGRNKTGRAFKQVEGSLTRMGSLAGRAAGALGLVGGVSLGFLVRDTIKSAASMEKLAASMKTVTGSSANAAAALKPIKEFAKTTPFDLQQAVQGFVKLKALGLDPSIDSLRSYGNTASAMGKDLNQMIEAVADAATGEFERLKEFGIKAKSQGDQVTFTFQGVATTIGKNAAEIEGYLKGIGNNAFGSAMSDQMDTIGGASSNLKDSLFELQVRFSETSGLSDALKSGMLKVSEAFSTATQYLSENKDKVQEIIGIIPIATKTLILFGATFLALKTGTAVVIAMSSAMSLMGASVTALGIKSAAAAGGVTILKGAMALLGGPVGVIALAVTALGFYIFKAQRAAEASVQFSRSINEMSATGSQFEFDRIDKELSGLNEEFKKAKSKLDDFNASGFRHINMQAALESKLADVKKRIIEAQNAHKKVTAAAEKNRKEAERLEKIQTDLNNSFKTTNVVVPQTGRNLTNLTGDVKDLITRTKELFGVYGKFESAADEVSDILLQNSKDAARLDGLLKELNKRFPEGTRDSKAYKDALESAGFQTKTLGDDTEKTTGIMADAWERFKDSAFTSLQTFWRSGLDGTKSFSESIKNLFKDMIAGILAQITALIASNLFKKFLDFLNPNSTTSTGIFDGVLSSITGSGGKSGGGGISAGNAISAAGGIGKAASAVSGIQVTAGATLGDLAIAGVGKVVGGVKAAGAAISAAYGSVTSALAAVPGWGWAAAAALSAAAAIFGGGGRSPFELGTDQLNAVNRALEEGRTAAVDLGDSLTFRGGFDEFSYFFDIAGKTKNELQEIGKAYQRITGADQALALNNTTLRIEDFSRNFSESNNLVIEQLRQAIAEVENGAIQAAGGVQRAFSGSLSGIIIDFDGLRRNLEREINVKVNTQTNQQAPSRAEQQNTNNLQTLTNIAVGNSIQNQPLFGT